MLFTIMCVRTQKIYVVRAIRYQFVKMSYVHAAHDDRILFTERLLQWAYDSCDRAYIYARIYDFSYVRKFSE